MSKPSLPTLLGASVLLGAISPFLAELSSTGGGPSWAWVHAWFYVGPVAAAGWFWTDEPMALLGLAIVVFTLQYLAVLGLVVLGWSRLKAGKINKTQVDGALTFRAES